MKNFLLLLFFPTSFFSCESLYCASIENKSGDKIILEFNFFPQTGRDKNQLGWSYMSIENLDNKENITDNYTTDFTKNATDSMSMIIELENNQSLEMSNGMNTSFAFYILKSLKVTFSDGGSIFAKNLAIVNLFNIIEEPGYTTRKSIFRIEQSFGREQYNSMNHLE